MEGQERLQKYLAECGVASRRKSEELIKAGRVAINGVVTTELGTKVASKDHVTVDGQPVRKERNKVYIMLNKPTGCLSTAKDDRDRMCVLDLIEGVNERLYPVGRLDYDTSGLIILTNDGDFMQKVTHPSHEVWKAYEAVVRGEPTEKDVEKFKVGIMLEDGRTLPALLTVIGHKGNDAIVEVRIREGRNRQVRRMLDAIGHPVRALRRTEVGPLNIGDLKVGQWRYLTEKEIASFT